MKVRYRQRALSDIAGIHQYIAEQNPRAATEVVARIRAAIGRLEWWPRIGHAGQDSGTYEWVVVGLPYIVVYEVDEANGEVARHRPLKADAQE